MAFSLSIAYDLFRTGLWDVIGKFGLLHGIFPTLNYSWFLGRYSLSCHGMPCTKVLSKGAELFSWYEIIFLQDSKQNRNFGYTLWKSKVILLQKLETLKTSSKNVLIMWKTLLTSLILSTLGHHWLDPP